MKSIHHPILIIYSPFTFEKETTKHFFFLKLQCEKEGENAIKHKYFMSKIQVRKKFNDQRLLRKE